MKGVRARHKIGSRADKALSCTVPGRLSSPRSEPSQDSDRCNSKLFLWVMEMDDSKSKIFRWTVGYVYAVIFSDGVLKIGRGKRPKNRVKVHSAAAVLRGATVKASIISGRLLDSHRAEKELINFCMAIGDVIHGREWFSGVKYEKVEHFISKKFSGDPSDLIDEAMVRTDTYCFDVVSAINEKFATAASNELLDDAEWAEALIFAESLEQIFVSDMFGGQYFDKSESGMSPFKLHAAIAMHGMDAPEVVGLLSRALDDPESVLDEIGRAVKFSLGATA